ncbi:hypothetical protein BX666DRAFT_1959101 [Dichotomocladium elegans]|nr:hypothetical protein BX666DRAFT_1959101 [Dichotomocladium elegans]
MSTAESPDHHHDDQKHFVDRVATLPFIQEGVAYANDTRLGRLANETFATISQNESLKNYYSAYFQRHVERADDLGCRSLDLIQEKLPVLTTAVEQKSNQVRAMVGDRHTKLVESLETLQNTVRNYAANSHKTATELPHTWFQDLANQFNSQVSTIVAHIKEQPMPDWVKGRVLSLVDIASKQYELVREQYQRTDISNIEKVRTVVHGVQEQVVPVLQTAHSQLLHYTSEKTENLRSIVKIPASVTSH